MFVVTGITGRVGGIVAETLLAARMPVRAVVRERSKGEIWAARGCEIAELPSMTDIAAMTAAFSSARGVFLMNPPNYDPDPNFTDTRAAAATMAQALSLARPQRAVFLSSVGAQVDTFNLLNNAGIIEEALRAITIPVAMLRPAWFMENAASDIAAAQRGALESYLQPLGHPIAMVSVQDIGRNVAERLQTSWDATHVVELEGPRRYSAKDLATILSRLLGLALDVNPIARDGWETTFRTEGMKHPEARMRMLDGFNEGWIDFEGGKIERRIGDVTLEAALAALLLQRK